MTLFKQRVWTLTCTHKREAPGDNLYVILQPEFPLETPYWLTHDMSGMQCELKMERVEFDATEIGDVFSIEIKSLESNIYQT